MRAKGRRQACRQQRDLQRNQLLARLLPQPLSLHPLHPLQLALPRRWHAVLCPAGVTTWLPEQGYLCDQSR